MDESTKKKQTYLRTEILEKGYDPSKFVEYLSQQKTDGEDIDTWTFQDLKDAVQVYVQNNPRSENTQPHFASHDGEDSVDEDENDDEAEKKPRLSMVQQSSMAEEEARKLIMNDEKSHGNDTATDDTKRDDATRNSQEPSSLNDKRQEMKKALIVQSDAERAAMNDFTFDTVPAKPPKLNELNGEKRLKIRISEQCKLTQSGSN